MTLYTKNGKCWHIYNIGKQAWKRGMKEKKFRLLTRMMMFDYSTGNYQVTDFETSNWSKESYILFDASDIIKVTGQFTLYN